MKTILSTILGLIVTCSPVVATKQRSDFLEYQSQIYEFGHHGATPLVDYFKRFDIDPPDEFRPRNTNLDRGHIAHWRVYDGKLWLVSIYMPSQSDDHSEDGREGLFLDLWLFPLARIFPDRGQVVHADWFTGSLRVSRHPFPTS